MCVVTYRSSLEMLELEMPSPPPGDALVQVLPCPLCSST
jgi:hypothetical protein